MTPTHFIHPTTDRISSIDILRGFALLGIILVNVLGFNASFFSFGGFYSSLPDAFQQNFYTVYISLTADKFVFIFSFLFGYGIFMQYRKFSALNGNFNGFFIRRMLILALFACAHILLLWAGDILMLYAIAGLIILALHKLPPALLGVLAVFFYFFIGLWLAIGVSIHLPDAMTSTCTECLEQAKITYSQGNYIECFFLRMQEYFAFRNNNMFYYLPKIIGVSLFGFICSRYNLHQNITENKVKWSSILIILGIIAVIIYCNYEKFVDFEKPYAMSLFMTGYELMNLFVASFYLLLILIVASFHGMAKLLKPMALMGKMSLTNYLMQSFFLGVIFYGWGVGLFGQTDVTAVVLIALAVFAVQLLLNVLWFRYFKQGPLEKIWRKWSYGTKKQ